MTRLYRLLWVMAWAAPSCVAPDTGPTGTAACARDPDCAPGTYCTPEGACGRDCRVDIDCAEGQTCDARGRCRRSADDAGVTGRDDAASVDDVGAPAADPSPENPFATDPMYESEVDLGGADPSRRAYGTELGSYRGVAARSNYVPCEPSPRCYFDVTAPRTVGTYGYQYQCVEYVIRFYAEALGYPGLRGTGDAIKYWDAPGTAAARRLERYANGGTVAPQPDDMIIFRGGTHGHIAVVRAVTGGAVHIIQQNWYHNPEDGDHALALSASGERYTVAAIGRGGAYPVVGWLRAPGRTGGCPTPDCMGNGTCISGACVCSTGYAGGNCERCAEGYGGFPTCRASTTDPCAGISCNGRGACASGRCACTGGWSGTYCTIPPDPCAGNDCSGHGTCSGGTCACVGGWNGPNCATPPRADPCEGVDCNGHGTCTSGRCACTGGWSGANCTTPPDPCAGITCNGHGTCASGRCACTGGWSGTYCATPPDPCAGNNCSGRGTCSGGTCVCASGWTGARCETAAVGWNCANSSYGGMQYWTCSGDSRYRCSGATPVRETCSAGCFSSGLGHNDYCISIGTGWNCANSSYGGMQYWTCSGGSLRRCSGATQQAVNCPSGCRSNGLGRDDSCN